jgi:hypothetical protein
VCLCWCDDLPLSCCQQVVWVCSGSLLYISRIFSIFKCFTAHNVRIVSSASWRIDLMHLWKYKYQQLHSFPFVAFGVKFSRIYTLQSRREKLEYSHVFLIVYKILLCGLHQGYLYFGRTTWFLYRCCLRSDSESRDLRSAVRLSAYCQC